MAQYSTGTVSTTEDSNIVTGVGTSWLTYVDAGDWIRIADDPVVYQIATVDSDTQIHLTADYPATVSEEEYLVHTDFTSNYNLPILSQGDHGAAEILARLAVMLDTIISSAGGGESDTFLKGDCDEEGFLTITHGQGREIVDVVIKNPSGYKVIPGDIQYLSITQVKVDLRAFFDAMGPTDEWGYLVR